MKLGDNCLPKSAQSGGKQEQAGTLAQAMPPNQAKSAHGNRLRIHPQLTETGNDPRKQQNICLASLLLQASNVPSTTYLEIKIL
jgi:hypothetical protein